jgi:hypothetical protein
MGAGQFLIVLLIKMKILPCVVLVLLARAMDEPEPITAEEEADEVAQAQNRARWIACLSLASTVVEEQSAQIEALVASAQQGREAVVRKVAASILEDCDSKISWQLAEEILSGSRSDKAEELVREVGKVKTQGFVVELSKKQDELIRKISEDMMKTDDGFDQEPPIVAEVAEGQQQKFMVYGVCGLLIVVCLGVIWTLMSSGGEEQPKEKTETGKRKRE